MKGKDKRSMLEIWMDEIEAAFDEKDDKERNENAISTKRSG
jgi:hypothetical protein